ncbi:MAG: glycosyltransferase family 4 protein [Flavobacteriales bacterium]|nr:glycosyltransferase family 4 protein [Flavobacteriales bacterium]
MKDEKHILLIAYYWPPSGGAGVQRWLKMLKYLSQDNVKCTVITVDPKLASYPILDESLVSDVPNNIRVVTTKTREPLNAYKKMTNSKESPYAGFANESNPSLLKKFARWVRANFFIPDARKGWNKFAYRKAIEIISTEEVDTVITTSPPHSTQLVGLKLKQKLNVHWIADIRDPWTDIYYSKLFPQMKWAKKKDENYENQVLTESDNVIVVSEEIKSLFARKGSFSKDKIHVIPNGFDPVDFEGIELSPVPESSLKITYTGTISEQYPMDAFTNALEEVKDQITLTFVGKVAPNVIEKLQPFSPEFKGYIPHDESLLELQNADVLLLIIPRIENNKGILTGKLFEYLGSQKPIILIGPPDGDAAEIVRQCQSGRIFDYHESSQINVFFHELIESKKKGRALTTPLSEEIQKYSRKNQAKLIKQLLYMVID